MKFLINIFKQTATKVTLFILLCLFVASLFLYWTWWERQFNKIWGFYYVSKGDKAYKLTKYQDAVDYYKKALEYYPGHSRAGCNLGNIYVTFENYNEAVNSYRKALEYSPNYNVCRMDLGIILAEKLADFDGAIREYRKIVNSKPLQIHIPMVYNSKDSTKINKGRAYYNMGLAYKGKAMYLGEGTENYFQNLRYAREAYRAAKEILPTDYDILYNLALTNHLLGDFKNAGLEYCNAIQSAPYEFEAHFNLALLLRTLNMQKESLGEFEKTGMLLDNSGDINKNKYIYGVLNEVKHGLISKGEYDYLVKRTDITAHDDSELAYKNGVVDLDKTRNNDFTKILKDCPYKKTFEEM